MQNGRLFQLVRDHRQEILALAATYGARNVRIFGSVARGDEQAQSDIDFLVDMEKGRSLLDLGGLLHDMEKLLACHVDVVTENGIKPRMHDRIVNESIPI